MTTTAGLKLGSIRWGNPTQGRDELSQLVRRRGLMAAPATYSKKSKGSPMQIYIEKYYTGLEGGRREDHHNHHQKAKSHIILLSGGPGQRSSVWREDLGKFSRLLGPSVTLWLMDQRGVGRSTRETRAIDQSWRYKFNPTRPPKYYSITNSAHDITLLARNINQKYGKNASITLLGVSYGGLLAARAVALHPNTFDWLVMDSPSMIKGRFSLKGDWYFWKNCLDDNFCKSQVKSRSFIRKVYNQIVTGRCQNECTRLLSNPAELLRPFLRGDIADNQEGGGGRTHPAMLIVPFIIQAYHCKDLKYFKKSILEPLQEIRQRNKITTNSLVNLREVNGRHTHQIHDFHNSYICVSEIFEYPKQPKECNIIRTVADQCGHWGHYRKAFDTLKPYLYSPDSYRFNPINTTKTKVIVLMGGMDLVTPPEPTLKWLDSIKAPFKFPILYRNLGHGLAPHSDCLSYLFATISESSSKRKGRLCNLFRCVDRINKERSLDWTFPGEYGFARSWWRIL